MGFNGAMAKAGVVTPGHRLCGVCRKPILIRKRPDGRPELRGCCVRKYHPSCARVMERRRHRDWTKVQRRARKLKRVRRRLRMGSLASSAAAAFPEMVRLAGQGFGVEFSPTPATFIGQALTFLWLNDYSPGLFATRSTWWVAVTVFEEGERTRRCSIAPEGVELHLVLAALLIQLLEMG